MICNTVVLHDIQAAVYHQINSMYMFTKIYITPAQIQNLTAQTNMKMCCDVIYNTALEIINETQVSISEDIRSILYVFCLSATLLRMSSRYIECGGCRHSTSTLFPHILCPKKDEKNRKAIKRRSNMWKRTYLSYITIFIFMYHCVIPDHHGAVKISVLTNSIDSPHYLQQLYPSVYS